MNNPEPQSITPLYTGRVVGVQHSDYQRIDPPSKVEVGDRLSLIHNPANPKDKYAIEVYWNDIRIGFVKATDTMQFHGWRMKGDKIKAELCFYDPLAATWDMFHFMVLPDDQPQTFENPNQIA